ncbi:type VI secretion system transmembrane protein TssO [Hymenobacter cellulosilyticus]|uniref:Type VI secretion system transmembrane protein TssO n=1 Tax=Hymenobacter cellulosilyticus TaxID=2932248 RepID=A0A8T9QC69_9BACT|nr:type VI secretion system transmembrane protein TssO [Hymenobacter cellulosilyticus]UOQ74795.1 type VI secretion system transmembrane protein TssO [Hymenobacter cellulosilyticus]
MKPLNQAERTTRLWKFALLYLLALVIPVTASYFLFSDGATAAENARLKKELAQTKDEQQRLLTQMDTLTKHLQRIDFTDRELRAETNDVVIGELNKRTQDYLNSIALSLNELRRDSARMQMVANKRIAQNVLRDFDLFRNNRSTIDFLRLSLDKRGIDVSGKEELAAELAQTKQLLATYQAAAANRPAPMPSGGGEEAVAGAAVAAGVAAAAGAPSSSATCLMPSSRLACSKTKSRLPMPTACACAPPL